MHNAALFDTAISIRAGGGGGGLGGGVNSDILGSKINLDKAF